MCVCIYVCSALDHGITPPGVTLDRPPSFHGPRWTRHPPPMSTLDPPPSSHGPRWTRHPPPMSTLDPPPPPMVHTGPATLLPCPHWTRHPPPTVHAGPATLLSRSMLVCMWDLVFITHTPKTQFHKVQRTDAEAEALILWPPDVKS